MADLGPVVGGLLELFGPVLGAALKALVRTVFGMVLLGSVVLALTVWFAANGSWQRGLLAGVLCALALGITTGVLAVKNAVLRGLLHALEKLKLGQRVLLMVFGQLGTARVPRDEAEAKLNGAVNALLAERAAKTGVRAWLARKLMTAALERVQAITLARFRVADSNGVDLGAVRDELAGAIDGLLARQLTAQLNRLNVAIAGLYLVLSAAIAVGLRFLSWP
jgi:hypothetical protein